MAETPVPSLMTAVRTGHVLIAVVERRTRSAITSGFRTLLAFPLAFTMRR